MTAKGRSGSSLTSASLLVLSLLTTAARDPEPGGNRVVTPGTAEESGSPASTPACAEDSPPFVAGISAGKGGDDFLLSFSAQYAGNEDPSETLPHSKEACRKFKGEKKSCCEAGFILGVRQLYTKVIDFPAEPQDPEQAACKASFDLGTERGRLYCDLNPGGVSMACMSYTSTEILRHGCYHLGLIIELSQCDAAGTDRKRLASVFGIKAEPSPPKQEVRAEFPQRSENEDKVRTTAEEAE